MEWLNNGWSLLLCSAAPILAIAIVLYILGKFGYNFMADWSIKKVEVTRQETPTKKKR